MHKWLWIGFVLISLFIVTSLQRHDFQSKVPKNITMAEVVSMSSSEPNSNSNRVEVDGILFETLMPVQTIHVPQFGEQVPVQLGVRITNQSSTSYRFNLPGFIPKIFDRDGQEIRSGINSNARRLTEDQDVPLLNPGEQIVFWTTTDLYWRGKNCFGFGGKVDYGGVWSTAGLKAGTYYFRLRYGFQVPQYTFLFHYGRTTLADFWVGTVHTPPVKFHLVK